MTGNMATAQENRNVSICFRYGKPWLGPPWPTAYSAHSNYFASKGNNMLFRGCSSQWDGFLVVPTDGMINFHLGASLCHTRVRVADAVGEFLA